MGGAKDINGNPMNRDNWCNVNDDWHSTLREIESNNFEYGDF